MQPNIVRTPDDAAPGDRVKVLLVDDLPENLLALSALLRRDDVELLEARSGREALELLLVHEVALALIDVQMPEMDGFQLAELMRGSDRSRRVPIIFVTAGASDQRRTFEGYQSGAVDFLFKPIEPHVLRSKAEVFYRLHRQQQQLARELHERTETLRLSELFTAMLGHDLRSPLSTIMLSARILQSTHDDGTREVAERIVRNGALMGRMIADMLDLARGRLGKGLAVERRELDLGRLVGEAVLERRMDHPDRALHLSAHGDLIGCWDPDRLTQVVSNLVGNAIAHGDPARPVDVRLDGTRPERVELSVSNGRAIPPDVLPHVFDPFRRGAARTATPNGGGLGLGMYIVRLIATAHGGEVCASADAASDTTVIRVTLPRR
jgi:signal transduction histidine kinase